MPGFDVEETQMSAYGTGSLTHTAGKQIIALWQRQSILKQRLVALSHIIAKFI